MAKLVEINQRSERDWAVYADGEYKGTVSRIGVTEQFRPYEFVCTHTRQRYLSRDEAVDFLVNRKPPSGPTQVSWIEEYGLEQKLSRPITVF